MAISQFLQDRYAAFLIERSGEQTVSYIAFDKTSVDSDSGDVDKSTAYNTTPILISALVDLTPSRAARDAMGQDANFSVLLQIARIHIETKSITLKIGDAFILNGELGRYFVDKVVRTKQVGDDFLSYLVSLSKEAGINA